MSSTALSATRFSIAALAFAPYVWRGLKLPHVRRSAAELALWLLGGLLLHCPGCRDSIRLKNTVTSL
jgi:drug/metabolite transporter (DMT)-like permease